MNHPYHPSHPHPSLETLSDLLDNALPLRRRWQVRRHVNRCPTCARHLAAEVRLIGQARAVAAEATAPGSLRGSVFRSLLLSRHPAEYTPRQYTPRLLAAAACSLLVFLAVLLLRPAVVPLPAFAQVVEAMEKVRTARWQEEFWEYDVKTKKVHRSRWTHSARLDSPALSTQYLGSHRTVLTPENLKVEQKRGFRVYSAQGFFSVEQNPRATSSSVLRAHILRQIAPPRAKGGRGGSASWRSRKEMVDGQELLRFDSSILSPKNNGRAGGEGAGKEASSSVVSRLTTPGYKFCIWANPRTLRIVRTETEYYDGQKHSRTVSTNYQYDLALPPSDFVEKRR